MYLQIRTHIYKHILISVILQPKQQWVHQRFTAQPWCESPALPPVPPFRQAGRAHPCSGTSLGGTLLPTSTPKSCSARLHLAINAVTRTSSASWPLASGWNMIEPGPGTGGGCPVPPCTSGWYKEWSGWYPGSLPTMSYPLVAQAEVKCCLGTELRDVYNKALPYWWPLTAGFTFFFLYPLSLLSLCRKFRESG